jgi:tetratricopeptide (TPR) repeat protein
MSEQVQELIHAGYQARRENRSKDARGLFVQAAELAEAAGDEGLKVDALRGWANSESDLGRLDEASERYAEAVAILRKMDDPLRLAHAVRHLADVRRKQGRVDDARACYEETLAIYGGNAATAPLDLGNALRGYGLLLEDLGDRAKAKEVWEDVLRLYTEVGVQAGIDEATRRVAALKAASTIS